MPRRLLVLFALVVLAVPAVAAARPQAEPTPQAFVRSIGAELNGYWSPVFKARHKTYRWPHVFLYKSQVRTRCGLAPVDNAFYCTAERSIYLDYGFVSRLMVLNRFTAATVLAHEWGHYVQDRLGWLAYAYARRFYLGKELQADCYAGLFAAYAEDQGLIATNDLDAALTLMTASGDDPRVARDSRYAHGSPGERAAWFRAGYLSRKLAVCDSVYRKLYRS